jgi:arylsulfatase A-like enzyme
MPDRPPNLLFLYTDEQRYDTLACYGNERIEMPNLNRLAESATVFDEAEVPDHSADLCSQQEYIAGKNDPVRTIITPDGWRYSHSPRGDHELYNLREDPGERRNLAGRGDTRDLTRDLTARIAAWRQRTGDTEAAG